MFESAELGRVVDKKTYEREVVGLREALLQVQFEVGKARAFPVIVIVGGVDAAGKGDTVNILNSWMDPRFITVHGLGEPTDEERARPSMWRYWQLLPPKGRIAMLIGSWYTQPILGRANGRIDDRDLDAMIGRINRFERLLVDEGALIVKLWLHLSKQEQRKRLKQLERDPDTQWRVSPTDWRHCAMANTFQSVAEHILRASSTAEAPWTIVEGFDWRYRSVTVGKALLEGMRDRLAQVEKGAARARRSLVLPEVDNRGLLERLNLSLALDKKDYERKQVKLQGKLNLLTRKRRFGQLSAVVVFEGCDAAGKGGAIRRITGALDARTYRIVPIAAPTDEERAQPYLWRFWRQLPRCGQVTIFDRSWYGRVLVERIEGFCSADDWMRAYGEINDFEAQLHEAGAVIVKFWLQISKAEQLRRFRARATTAFKRFKITPEDWRNRRKWDAYQLAVADMVTRTSTDIAPWTLVEADDKNYARIKILRTLCERIEAALAR